MGSGQVRSGPSPERSERPPVRIICSYSPGLIISEVKSMVITAGLNISSASLSLKQRFGGKMCLFESEC